MRRTLMEELWLCSFQIRVRVRAKRPVYIVLWEKTEQNWICRFWERSAPNWERPRLHSSVFSNRHDFARSRIPLEHWERPVLTWKRSVPTWDDPPSLAATRCQPSEFLPVHITGYIGTARSRLGTVRSQLDIYTLYINQFLSLNPFYYFIIKVIF